MKIQCPTCQTSIEPASLQGAAASRGPCPSCGTELVFSALVEAASAAAQNAAGEAVPLPGSPQPRAPEAQAPVPPAAPTNEGSRQEAAPPPAPTGGWSRQVAAPPQLGIPEGPPVLSADPGAPPAAAPGGPGSPPVVPEAPSAARARLKDIVFDDFDLDEEKPVSAADFVLETPEEEFAGTNPGDLPELALEGLEEPEEPGEDDELMPELPPLPEPTVLHVALESEPPEVTETSGVEVTAPPRPENAPPVLLSISDADPKGPSLWARIKADLRDWAAWFRNGFDVMPRGQKILVGGGLCLVPLAIAALFFFGEEEAPLHVPVPPPVKGQAPAPTQVAQPGQAPAADQPVPAAPAENAAAPAPPAAGGGKAKAKKAPEGEQAAQAEKGEAPESKEAGQGADEKTARAKEKGQDEGAPREPAVVASEARELLQQGKIEEGLELVGRGLEGKPNDTGLLLAQGELFAAQDNRAGALKACEAAAKEDPKSIEARLCVSRQNEARGKRVKALAAVEEALKIDPDHAEARFLRGELLEANGLFRDAAAIYEGMLQRKETREEALLRVARIHMALAEPHEVLPLLEKEVQGRSPPPALVEALADAHAGMQQWKKALGLYRKVAKRPGVAYKIAKIEMARGRVRQAIPFLVRATAEDGTPPEVFRDLGYSYKEVGRRQDAAKAFQDYLANKTEPADRLEIEEEIAQLKRG